ncbi:MAG: hypothetical protein V4466_10310 [Pseudomonadota bacterium]
MSRKLGFNLAALVIAVLGVVVSQWALTHQPPSVALAVLYPAMLLVTGLVAGLFAYLADPRDPTLPVSSNDHGPVREKTRDKSRERVRVKVRKSSSH